MLNIKDRPSVYKYVKSPQNDFEFNHETWRYEYVGYDKKLADKILSATVLSVIIVINI